MVVVEFEFRWGDRVTCFPSEEDYKKWLYLLFKKNPMLFHKSVPKPVQPSVPEDHDFGDLTRVDNLSAKLENAKNWVRFRKESRDYEANVFEFEDAISRGDKGVFKGIEWLEDILPLRVTHKDSVSPETMAQLLEYYS